MKTIQEVAKNSFDRLSIAGADTNEADFIGGFKIGVEFAQQWISVENEFPEDTSELPLICRNETSYFLCWVKRGRFKNTTPTPVHSDGFCDGNLFREDLTNAITHWRPIEFK